MASLRKRNSRWEVRVRRSGQLTQTKTFTLKSDAQQWARKVEIALDKGELLQMPKVSPITLEGAAKRYLEEVAIHHKGVASERYRLWKIANRLGKSKLITAITSKDIFAPNCSENFFFFDFLALKINQKLFKVLAILFTR